VLLVDGPDGPLEVLVTGSGQPVTVFAHGLASSIDETRPFGSGVRGTRVFFHFRGHGRSHAQESDWSYASLASELLAVVRQHTARRALGVSLGAGAILAAAYRHPGQFDKLVLALPGALDRPRDDPAIHRMHAMARLVETGDLDALRDQLVADQPIGAQSRSDVAAWAGRRARSLAGTDVARALAVLPAGHPLEPGADLSAISCPVLVVGQEGDAAHPADLARETADRLPHAQLHIFDSAGLVWAHRAELRELVSTFLNGTD
jgi:3-oxoadipate enol-lactonase